MKNSERIVLVPVDFSEQSFIALEQAVSLSTYFQTSVNILHIVEKDVLLGKNQQKLSILEDQLKEVAIKFSKPNVPVDILIKEGDVADVINKTASDLMAVFIVMGVNSGSKFKRRLIGKNSLSVVRESIVPVITIKGKHHRVGCKTIVLPLDLSVETTQKVSNAIEFAKLGVCSIKLMSVLFSSDEESVGKIVKQMEDVRNHIMAEGIICTAEMVKVIKGEETVAQVIIDYSEKVEADLIMIMTQQESLLKDRLLGSTAEEIVVNSDVPVLSVIPKHRVIKQ
jgi:nucleotide-binding universal stress UspA family protein